MTCVKHEPSSGVLHSVTARVSTAAGPRTLSCSSPTAALSKPTWRRSWRMWKKQTAATLAVCFFIVSSESNRTPRSHTTSDGLIVVPTSTVSDRSCDVSLLMAAVDPIHIASVSCQHLAATVASCTTGSHRRCSHSAVVEVSNCMHVVEHCRSMTSTMKPSGPSTEPCGTEQSNGIVYQPGRRFVYGQKI